MTRLDNSSGFTLIELVISISIAAVLSALAITSFAVYKEQAKNTEQKQLFNIARKALEARDDNVSTIAGSYRRVWQPYNSDTWYRLYVPTLRNFVPGIPTIMPDHMDFYLREYKCNGSNPWCQTQFVESWNCETGNWIYFIEYYNGTYYNYEGYNASIDDDC